MMPWHYGLVTGVTKRTGLMKHSFRPIVCLVYVYRAILFNFLKWPVSLIRFSKFGDR